MIKEICQKTYNMARKVILDEDGQALTEYALVLALIAVAAIAVLGLLAAGLIAAFQDIVDALPGEAAVEE